jgi:hypothetical protein
VLALSVVVVTARTLPVFTSSANTPQVSDITIIVIITIIIINIIIIVIII